MRVTPLLLIGITVAAFGCSSSSTPAAPLADAGAADAAAATPDANPAAPEPEPEAPPCEPIITATSKSSALLSKESTSAEKVWIYRAEKGEVMLTLTVREKLGGPTEAADGKFGEEQLEPSKTGVTLLVQTKCEAHGDHFHCGPSFVPTAGTWSFSSLGTSVGKRFTGSISADLVQATIKGGVAKPTEGGQSLCLRDLALDAVLAAP